MCPSAITHVETRDHIAALTFDDGPHPVYTPRLLSILEKHGVPATFFIVGESAQKHPEITRMIAKAGHAIGNHSWNHPNLVRIQSRYRRLKQLLACAIVTAPYCKRLFRPPWGQHNDQTRLDAFMLGHKVIMWNVSVQDWLPQGAEETARKLMDRVIPGSIVLLHDAIYRSAFPEPQWDRGPTLAGLDMALDVLKQRLHFVTVPVLLRAGRPVRQLPR